MYTSPFNHFNRGMPDFDLIMMEPLLVKLRTAKERGRQDERPRSNASTRRTAHSKGH
jgi:hypothetical protein